MTLHTLDSPAFLSSFLSSNTFALVCFSATWCGPCRASHPQLVALANSYRADPDVNLSVAIIYEHSLGDEIHRYSVRAFPTYILFQQGREIGRVQGVNFAAIQEMVEKSGAKSKWTSSGDGHSLGGTGAVPKAEDVKAARMARLVGLEQSRTADADEMAENAAVEEQKEQGTSKMGGEDAKMSEPKSSDPTGKKQPDQDVEAERVDPTSNLDAGAVEELTTSMGFPLIRAQKGLLYGGNTTEGAVEWLLAHQEDDDIDIPIPLQRKSGEMGAEGRGSGEGESMQIL